MKEYIVAVPEHLAGDLFRGDPELIRCKDCKFSKAYYHGSESNLGMFTYECTHGFRFSVFADNYCSSGERKEE